MLCIYLWRCIVNDWMYVWQCHAQTSENINKIFIWFKYMNGIAFYCCFCVFLCICGLLTAFSIPPNDCEWNSWLFVALEHVRTLMRIRWIHLVFEFQNYLIMIGPDNVIISMLHDYNSMLKVIYLFRLMYSFLNNVPMRSPIHLDHRIRLRCSKRLSVSLVRFWEKCLREKNLFAVIKW